MSRRLRAWQLLVGFLYDRDQSSEKQQVASAPPRLWAELISLANEHLVTASLWSALRRAGFEASIPADAAEYLRAFHDFNSARNRAILAQLDELVAALNDANVEPMPLKGSAYLISGLYPELGDRYLSDIDLLVPDGAIPQAESVLARLGYQPAYEKDYSRHHHLVPMVHAAHPVAVEVHRSPLPSYAQRAIASAGVWREATRTSTGDARIWLPSPTDSAMLSFVNSQIVDRNESLLLLPLRLFNDVHLLQRRHAAGIDWTRNLDRSDGAGVARRLRRYLNVYRELTGVEACSAVRGSAFDAAYFRACRAAISWPVIGSWAARAERLSKHAIVAKYGVRDSEGLGRYRLRELADMLRRESRS